MNRHALENALRRHDTTINQASDALDRGRFRNSHHRKTTEEYLNNAIRARESTKRQLADLDRMEGRHDYRSTNMGYNSPMSAYATQDDLDRFYDMFDKILSEISGYSDNDAEDRQGVKGTGKYSRYKRGGGGRVRVSGYTRKKPRMDDTHPVSDDDYSEHERMAEAIGYAADKIAMAADAMNRAASDRYRGDDYGHPHNDRTQVYPHVPPVMPRQDTHVPGAGDTSGDTSRR